MIVALIAFVLQFGILMLVIAGIWKTYTKAGQPGWAAIVPIYNFVVMADIARVSRNQVWKALAVGVVGGVIYTVTLVQAMYGSDVEGTTLAIGVLVYFASVILTLYFLYPIFKGIALNFGQSVGFAWGLMLLGFIFFPILGFGTYQYQSEGGYQSDDVLDSYI
jgi:hypothetical protein